MKFREIFRFEFVYQVRRIRTWLYLVVLLAVGYLLTRNNVDEARNGGTFVNSPYAIAAATAISSVLWVLMATAVAGRAAARDMQTRMHPLVHTTPIKKSDYLGGRALAALALHALILFAVPAGMLLALFAPPLESDLLGPFRPAAYLTAYALLALPTAFAATAIQFSMASLGGRAGATYLGSVLLLVTSLVAGFVTEVLRLPALGRLLDPIGFTTIVGVLSRTWTPIEKNTVLVGLEPWMLANRAGWLAVGLAALAFAHYRFRFAHPTTLPGWTRRRAMAQRGEIVPGPPISVPTVTQTFGVGTRLRQVLVVTRESFAMIAWSRLGLVVLIVVPILIGLLLSTRLYSAGVPLLPRTERIVALLTSPLTAASLPWVIIPLLTVFWAGELVWRERDARVGEITDTMPVPDWVLLLGKFVGLGLVLVTWTSLLMLAGMLVQVARGYNEFEVGLYALALLGLQLSDYLLFAMLAVAIHVIVSEKYVAHMAALIAYGGIVFAPRIGIEHNLLIYGSDPGWFYSDMRAFGPSLGPWAWFTLYWTAWALVLAVTARLLWIRGREADLQMRLRLARQRCAGATAAVGAAAVTLVLALGGFIFYNTNVLNAYETAAGRVERGAAYERRYGGYDGIPQPRLAATSLRVEIYPERREAEVRGTYRLVNDTRSAIASVHLATAAHVETTAVAFDRPVARAHEDAELGHRTYDLAQPLQPGDTVRVSFEVHYQPRGFRHDGADTSIVANGTYFRNYDWLPAIGYQRNRRLLDRGSRRQYGLAPRPVFASLDDAEARQVLVGGDRIAFEAIVGTTADQIAVAPGVLQKTWTERGRRYFHYAADTPINNRYAFFSARYAVHTALANDVAVEIYHDPRHARLVERIAASARAALEFYTRQFGSYPYGYLRLIENPTRGMGAHAEAATIDYGDDFSLLNPGPDGQELDFVLAVVGHEVAHEWWGMQLTPGFVEGAGLLDEGIAMYSAMRLLEQARGPEQLRRYRLFMQEEYRNPRTRAARPLLRATDDFAFYRRTPFALYALREYIGKEPVDAALRRLFEKYRTGAPPLPTSVHLYRELQAVTPASLHYLLHDLFEANTFWDLETKRVNARQTADGSWQVTLDVRARKAVVDETGVEKEVAMDELVPVGVFTARAQGEASGKPLYLQAHRIRTGEQTISMTVAERPSEAGVDPDYLLHNSEGEIRDNVAAVTVWQ